MKKIKKFFLRFFILIIFAAVVFFLGWIQFYVKNGTCAVMTSKTGGLYKEAIVPGKFLWRWERLLPTNVHLENFSLASVSTRQVCSGFLPSGNIYAKEFDSSADFSYKLEMNISLSASPQAIYQLYKENKIQNNDELQKFLEQKSKQLASTVVETLLKEQETSSKYIQNPVLDEEFISKLSSNPEFSNLTINSIEFVSAKIPDVKFYNKVKDFYDRYLENLQQKVDKKAQEQASQFLEQDRKFQQLEKFAELIKKYPELNELAKNGDLTQVMNALGN